MEEINKSVPSTAPETKATSESTDNSLEFELVSKKDRKFPWVWVILTLLFVSLITVGALVYLNIISLPL
jgi:hypothetical protein